MPTFLIDEDLPRSTGKVLRDKGYKVLDVRDCGLRGQADKEVFAFAQKEKAVLLTGDLGFGNLLHYPVGKHSGIVIVHFPNEISAKKQGVRSTLFTRVFGVESLFLCFRIRPLQRHINLAYFQNSAYPCPPCRHRDV